jgi:hypothetical protein
MHEAQAGFYPKYHQKKKKKEKILCQIEVGTILRKTVVARKEFTFPDIEVKQKIIHRTVCLLWVMQLDLNVNLIQKHSHRNIQSNV